MCQRSLSGVELFVSDGSDLFRESEMPVLPTSVYPLRGMFYLLSHPSLCRRLACGLFAMVLFSIVASILLFIFAFPWQAEALSGYTSVWLAWLISLLLTVLEIGTSVLIFSSVFLAQYMSQIFDAVCREETMLFNREETPTPLAMRYSCLKSLVILLIFRVFLLVVTSPLNLLPLLGTLLYIYVNAFYYAWSLHCRYFDLLGLTFAQGLVVFSRRTRNTCLVVGRHFAEANRSAYTQFGLVAVLLELIPLVNIVSPMSNVIGSALWACDIERYSEGMSHPRRYLICPSASLIEQGQQRHEHTEYGTTAMTSKEEKELVPPPPNYEDVVPHSVYPSAPSAPDEKQ